MIPGLLYSLLKVHGVFFFNIFIGDLVLSHTRLINVVPTPFECCIF